MEGKDCSKHAKLGTEPTLREVSSSFCHHCSDVAAINPSHGPCKHKAVGYPFALFGLEIEDVLLVDDFSDTLEMIQSRCDAIEAPYSQDDVREIVQALKQSAEDAGKAWCGSWFGYHSRVYYSDLEPVPPGARFSQEWGFLDRYSNATVGNWTEYGSDTLYEAITSVATKKTLDQLKALSQYSKDALDDHRETVLSIIDATLAQGEDTYLSRLKKDAEGCTAHSAADFVNYIRPSGKFFSRDTVALQAGLQTPPHIWVQAEVFGIESPKNSAISLRKVAKRLAKHLENKSRAHIQNLTPGSHVFIGHGRSHLWKDLKDFINDRMEYHGMN